MLLAFLIVHLSKVALGVTWPNTLLGNAFHYKENNSFDCPGMTFADNLLCCPP